MSIEPYRFGNITVLGQAKGRDPKRRYWLCRCELDGVEFVTRADGVLSGHVKSCGCLHHEQVKNLAKTTLTKHGLSHTSEYGIWKVMIARCYKPTCEGYEYYGGRGVTVCERWLDKENGFVNFYADMKPRPSNKHTIDRKDNKGNYEPENCRWATRSEQTRNFSRNHLLSFNGKTQPIVAWVEETGITRAAIVKRLIMNWPIDKILTTPVNQKYSNVKK